jgi:hypothetical protein
LSILSIRALSAIAERHIRDHGPTSVDDLVAQFTDQAVTPERAQAGIRLAVSSGRLTLDRDATVRVPTTEAAA